MVFGIFIGYFRKCIETVYLNDFKEEDKQDKKQVEELRSLGVNLIFGYPKYDDEAKKTIKETIEFMKKIWNGGNEYYKKY